MNHFRQKTKFSGFLLTIVLLCFELSAVAQSVIAVPGLKWFNALALCVEGKGWSATRHFYDRLPAKAEGVVRPSVWGLSEDSPGICIRFVTDATEISARWTLRKKKLALTNMPASGVSGLDLYVRFKGEWRWLGAARPDSVDNDKRLTTGDGAGAKKSPECRKIITEIIKK